MVRSSSGSGSSVVGALVFGPLLLAGSTCLIAWNEYRSVQTAHTITEATRSVVPAAPSASNQLEGRAIYIQTVARALGQLADKDFGVTHSGLRLRRETELYQWDEDEKKGSGNAKHYTYKAVWDDDLISSAAFHDRSHVNPKTMPYSSWTRSAEQAELGNYRLSNELIDALDDFTPLEGAAVNQARFPKISGHSPVFANGWFYYGSSPQQPSIGDFRVRFSVINNGVISAIGRQQGQIVAEFVGTNGRAVPIIQLGSHTALQLIDYAENENLILTWALRLFGGLLMFFGFAVLGSPFAKLASYVPGLGTLVEGGIMLFAFALSAGLTLLIIAVSWFAVRPLLSVSLLMIGALLFWLSARRAKQQGQKLNSSNT